MPAIDDNPAGSDTGIVASVKLAPNPQDNLYTVIGDRQVRAKADLVLHPYDKVRLDQTDSRGIRHAEILGRASHEEYVAVIKQLLDRVAFGYKVGRRTGIWARQLEEATAAMEAELRRAAYRLATSLLAGAPIIVRFHNDCDGLSGAMALFKSFLAATAGSGWAEPNVTWQINRSVAYEEGSFYSDLAVFNGHLSVEQPLIVITDFGTTKESEKAVELAKGRAEFVWLDHHPVYEGLHRDSIYIYINPWDFGSNSDYTAGFLSSTLAEFIYGIDAGEFKMASLIGDYSIYANRKDTRASKLAMALDYVTSDRKSYDNPTPRSLSRMMEDSAVLDEMYACASTAMGEALEAGSHAIKRYCTSSGINIFTLDFEEVGHMESSYPPPGKYSSRLQEILEGTNGDSTMTVVYYKSYISIRATRHVAEMVDMQAVADSLGRSTPYMRSFGGHSTAASIGVEREHIGEVVRLLLLELGARP